MTEAASTLVLTEVSNYRDTTEESLESLKAFSRILEASDRLARLIEKTQKYRDMVPPYILEQVQADYRQQKREVDEELKGQKNGFRQAYREHLSEREVLEKICQKVKDRLKELRFRRVVGEYDETDVQDEVRDLKKQLSESLERLDRMEEIIDRYVIIGFDDLMEREEQMEAEGAPVPEFASYEEEPGHAASPQEEETVLPGCEQERADTWGKAEEEEAAEEEPADPIYTEPEQGVEETAAVPPDRSSPAYPQGYLTILDGIRKGDRVPLIPADIMLGRSPNTDVMLTDQGIAESHGRIYFKDRKYFLENLDILGRSYVNGIQSKVAELHHNDVIRLGSLNLRVDFAPTDS